MRSHDVQLRDVEPGDLPALFQHQLDPEANRMAVVTPRDEHAFHAHWAKIAADPNVVAKAVVADGRLVGSINCFQADGEDLVGTQWTPASDRFPAFEEAVLVLT